MSITRFRQPGCHGFSALDPWLCVLAFQRVCLFVPPVLSKIKVNKDFSYFVKFSAKNMPLGERLKSGMAERLGSNRLDEFPGDIGCKNKLLFYDGLFVSRH
jgi:hypothetical protein